MCASGQVNFILLDLIAANVLIFGDEYEGLYYGLFLFPAMPSPSSSLFSNT
jgi:hypothetical protein